MKTTRTYLDGCRWCNATGKVPNPIVRLTDTIEVKCHVCKDKKTIRVKEVIETPEMIISTEPSNVILERLDGK